MPKVLKRNAIIVVGLWLLFCWAFFFAKHDPSLRNIIPFGEDPYDAVGSFAVIAGLFLAPLSLLRAFRIVRKTPDEERQIYLIRSQQAIVLTIFITLAADLVAMARHPSMWISAPAESKLLLLLGGVAAASAAVQLAILASQKNRPGHNARIRHPKKWTGAAISTVVAILILIVYPEEWIHETVTHLITVVAGAILLFAPIRPLLNALTPYTSERFSSERIAGRSFPAGLRWAVVVLLGVLVGAWAFLSEMAESTGPVDITHLAFVASVFIGLGLAGLLIAYAFLQKPLGLGA